MRAVRILSSPLRRPASARRPRLVLAALLAGTSLLLAAAPATAQDFGPCSPAGGWRMPQDVVGNNWNVLAWETFIALNWPAEPDGTPGEPDRSVSICDPSVSDREVAWMQYLTKDQVILQGGADPGTWEDPTVPAPTFNGLPVLGGLAKSTSQQFIDLFDEAGLGAPLIDQNGNYCLFDIRINQSEFTYISQTGYYDAFNQLADVPDNFKPFPKTGRPAEFDPPTPLGPWAQQGALEIKAAWRQLTADDLHHRYYTREVYFLDTDGETLCGPVTVGLVGFHILRLTPSTPSTWFWATFEQVDNVEVSDFTFPAPRTPSFNPGHGPGVACPPPYPLGYTCEGSDCNQPGDSCPPATIDSMSPSACGPRQPQDAVNVSRVAATQIPFETEVVNWRYRSQLRGTPWQY